MMIDKTDSRTPCQSFSAVFMLSFGLLLPVCGCSGSLPSVHPPEIDPVAFAQAALSQYDGNGDGVIKDDELEAAPSLRFSARRIDGDNDGGITAEELKQFVEQHWLRMKSGIVRIRCEIYMNGRPLDGATVTFEPEQFMNGTIFEASGVTSGGMARIDVSDENRPHPNARGAQNGLYLVRISKQAGGKETIPAKYNTETILGCEVAKRAAYLPGPVRFSLKSR